jgi:hypothetical protein
MASGGSANPGAGGDSVIVGTAGTVTNVGRDASVVSACVFADCDAAAPLEASVVTACLGKLCPTDADTPVEAGPCTSPASCTTVPDGWLPVAMTDSTCPSGFGNAQRFYTSASGAPYTCTCGCAGTQSCQGTATLNEYAPGADGGADCTGTPSTRTLSFSPSCGGGGGSIKYGYSYMLSDVSYGPAPACSASPSATIKAQVSASATTVCTPTSMCPGGACLQVLETRNLCVEKDGTNMCPGEFPNRTLMSSSYDDTRDCGPCTCGSNLTCTLTGLLLDNAANCALGHPYLMTATEACSLGPSDYPLNQSQATTTTTGMGACAMLTPSMPTGTVTLTDAKTITVCCK